ncbi:MAG: transposase [Trueperaceae bacterium]
MNLALIFRYVHALIVSIENNSALSFAESVEGASHDSFTRTLQKNGQWLRVLVAFVTKSALGQGYLILDDTILEKYTQGLRCIFKLRDSKTGNYVYGLNIVLLCWSDGKRCIPLIFHIYRGKGVSKLDLAMKLLAFAHDVLKLKPEYVLFDSYYGSRALMQQILGYHWHFVTRLKKNRKLNGQQIKHWCKRIPYWSAQGLLEGKIPVVVYRHGAKYFVSSNLELTRQQVRDLYKQRSPIDEVFRVLKQECGWQGCQLRSATAYRRHLMAGLLAFLFLDSLKPKYKASHYKLRKRCISRKIVVTSCDVAALFASA